MMPYVPNGKLGYLQTGISKGSIGFVITCNRLNLASCLKEIANDIEINSWDVLGLSVERNEDNFKFFLTYRTK